MCTYKILQKILMRHYPKIVAVNSYNRTWWTSTSRCPVTAVCFTFLDDVALYG